MIEPSEFTVHRKQVATKRRVVSLLLIILGLGAYGGWRWLYHGTVPKKPVNSATASVATPPPAPASAKTTLKKFTPDEFKDLYHSVSYPNTQPFTEPPSITGNPSADIVIRSKAEARGYRLTSIPVAAIVKINEPLLGNDDLLQPLAAQAWQNLKSAAAKDGIKMTLISAFRSPEYQRDLFMNRLLARGVTVAQVAAGQADQAVEANLSVTAVPGYSRHHTGYTVDLWCDDGSSSFVNSACYPWVSNNNYQHAKENGWIPSYPNGTDQQGPEPEPWEYVWVGTDHLYE
jgi:D-alanyl-D-alanine carboxypeptidase